MVLTGYFYNMNLEKGFFLVGFRYLFVNVSCGLTVEIPMWSSLGVAFHSKLNLFVHVYLNKLY